MRRRTLSLLAAVLFLTMLATPAAQASHTLGHRYLVQGIVVDADGNPVQNQEIRIMTSFQGQTQGVMAVQTHCDGRFYSPEGREIFDAGQGGGHQFIEGPNQDGETYFHYHDEHLTTAVQVSFTLLEEEWTAPFSPDTRSTTTRHQLAQTVEPGAACAQNYTAFYDAFVVHVRTVTSGELETGENAVDAREVSATLTTANGTETLSGTTNSNGDVWLQFSDASAAAAGDTVEIGSLFFSNQTVTLTDEDITYRYVDQFYKATEPQPGLWDRFGTLIIVLGVIGLIVVGYFGYQKAREKMELRKAYEQSGRKRTRR